MGMKDYETFSQNPCCWLSNTMFAMFVFPWFFGQKSSLQPQIQTKYNSNNIYKLCLLFLGLLVRCHLCNHNYRKNIITLTTAILKYISASAIEYHNKKSIVWNCTILKFHRCTVQEKLHGISCYTRNAIFNDVISTRWVEVHLDKVKILLLICNHMYLSHSIKYFDVNNCCEEKQQAFAV